MKHSDTNLGRLVFLIVVTIGFLVWAAPLPALGQQSAETNKVIPLIVMDNVTLEDAIRNVARAAGINYIIDPKVLLSGAPVSGRWQNLTAEQMLGKVLGEHKLKITPNPVTSVARVTASNHVTKPAAPGPVEKDTNNVIPVISLEDVQLEGAIKKLGAQANLKISFDPSLSAKTLGQTVGFRWENLTARQALAALLDNYELAMLEDPTSGTTRITAKKQAADKPPTRK